jgi:hypothetical protein
MTNSEEPQFSKWLVPALRVIAARNPRMQEYGELLGLLGAAGEQSESADLKKLARCITTPQGRAFLRGGLDTEEGLRWLTSASDEEDLDSEEWAARGVRSSGEWTDQDWDSWGYRESGSKPEDWEYPSESSETGEPEIRECDLLRWAFAAELMQLRISDELALCFVDQGIALRDIKSKTAQDLSEQQWTQVRGLMGPKGFPVKALEMILYKPESRDVRESANREGQLLFKPTEIKKLLEASFSALRDQLAKQERKLEHAKLEGSLKESLTDLAEGIGEMELDLLVKPELGVGFDAIRGRSLQNLSEALYHAGLNVEGVSFATLFQEAVRRANLEAAQRAAGGDHGIDFSQAIVSAWKKVVEENERLPFVTLVEGMRQDHAPKSEGAGVSSDGTIHLEDWAKKRTESSIKRAIWRMFRTWKRAIEVYPKRDDTLFLVRFYDLLAVSDFHAAAGNHPSPEGIARLTATEDFYFDPAVFRFLHDCEKERRQRGGYHYELIFNGDLLDFAQVVVPLGQRPPLTPWPLPPFLEFSPQDPTGRQGLSARGRSLPFRLFRTLARVHRIAPLAKAAYEHSKVLRAGGKSAAARSLEGFVKDTLCSVLEEEAERAARRQAPPSPFEVERSDALKDVLKKAGLEEVGSWLYAERKDPKDRSGSEDSWEYDEEWDDGADDEGWGSDVWAERGDWDSREWSDEDWNNWAYEEPWPEPDERAHDAWDQPTGEEWTARDMTRPRVLAMERGSALEQLADIYRGHRRMFQGLAWFLAQGNRLIVLRGNHDPQWYWPEVQLAFVGWLKNAYVEVRKECKSPNNYELPVSAQELEDYLPAVKLEEFEARIDFDHSWYYYRDRLAYFEHGGQQEAVDAHRFFLLPVYYEDAPATAHRKLTIQPEKPLSWLPALRVSPVEKEIEPPLGSLGQVFFVNNLETQFPNFDRPGYGGIYLDYVRYAKPQLIVYLLVAAGRTLGALWKWALYGGGSWARWVWRQVKAIPKPRSVRQIAQVVRNLPEWRGGPHDQKLKAYAHLTGLPLECTKALDQMSGWVRRWRAPVVGCLFKVLSICALLAVVAVPVGVVGLAIWEWWTDSLVTGLPWPLGAITDALLPVGEDPQVVKALVLDILLTVLFGFLSYWLVKLLLRAIGLGYDYLYKPSQKVAAILEKYGQSVPYLLFGHDHVRNAQRLEEGPWYLNTGAWLHKYEKDRRRLLREPLEYAFVRMVDTHRVLAAGPDDYMMPRPETRPEVELLRWNDDGGRVESCETFKGLDEVSVSNEYELIRRYEPILRFSRDGKGKREEFFPMAVENYVRECGLRRRRQKEWQYEPGQTPLRSLGRLPETPRGRLRRLYYRLFRKADLHEYYLVFAADKALKAHTKSKAVTETEMILLDEGLLLSQLPEGESFTFAAPSVEEKGQTSEVRLQGQIVWAIVSPAQADLLRKDCEFAVQESPTDQQIERLLETLLSHGQESAVRNQLIDRLLESLPSHEHKSAVQKLRTELKAAPQRVVIFRLDTISASLRKEAFETYEPYSDLKKHPPVYHYHVSQDGPYTVLQYWFLYAYNDWGFHGGFNDHEGDWEVVFVFLDQKQQPQYVAYSRHIKFPVLYEPEKANWSEVTEGGSHPIVYVGCGSHASYTRADWDQILGWIDYHEGDGLEIGLGTAQPWGHPIRLSNKAWNTQFSGNWGALLKHWGLLVKPGSEGPTSPAHKGDKWKEPAKWAKISDRDRDEEYELIRRYEPVLRYSKDGKGEREGFFPMAARHYVRECGLRRREKGWVYKPGQTSVYGLGIVEDSENCYLVYAAPEEMSDLAWFWLDHGLVLSRLPEDERFKLVPIHAEIDPRKPIGWMLLSQEDAQSFFKQDPIYEELAGRQTLTDQQKSILFGHEQEPTARTSGTKTQAAKSEAVMIDLPDLAQGRRNQALAAYHPYWEKHPPVYHYHVCQDGPHTVLQYWFLYAYSDWGFHGGLNDHEGNWEVISVFLDWKQEPHHVAYSRHVNIPMLFEPQSAKWPQSGTQPQVGLELDGYTHPIFHIGCGSHATYLSQEENRDPLQEGITRIAGFDDYHKGNSDAIGPGTAHPWGRPIRLSNQPWNTQFSGNWGALVKHWGQLVKSDTERPTSPAQQVDRWKRPAKWANIHPF